MEVIISFPQKAYETFKRLGSLPEMDRIFSYVSKVLGRIDDPIERARKAHAYVESYTNEVLANPVAKKMLTCHKGCSACCHTQVSASMDEAILLAKKVIDEGLDIDLSKLYIQGNVENSAREWFELPYEVRGCVFLDEQGSCRVYEDRPSVCRVNNAFSPPKDCDTRDGVEKPIRLLNTEKADMAIMAQFHTSSENSTLPNLLWKALNVLSEKERPKRSKKVIKKAYLKRVQKDLSKYFEV